MKKIKTRGIIFSLTFCVIFFVAAAALFFVAISPEDVYQDILNNGGIIFAKDTATVCEDDKAVDATGVNKIIVKFSVNAINDKNIKVVESEDEFVRLKVNGTYYSTVKKNNIEVKLEKSNNATIVAGVSAHHNGFTLIPFNLISIFAGDIELSVPTSFAGEIDLEVDSGTLDINLSNELSDLTVDISAGTVNLHDIIVKNLTKIKMSAGTLNCGKIVSKDLILDLSAGRATLESVCVRGEVAANISAGKLSLCIDEAPSKCTLNLSAGTINFTHKDSINFDISYKLSAGRLNAYGTRCKHSGRHNSGSGGIPINISMSAGTCNINKR